MDAAKNDKDLYGLRYSDFVVPLVKAVQELSAKNDTLQKQNDNLQLAVGNLQKEVDELKMVVDHQISGMSDEKSAIANPQLPILFQNTPNPFSQSTAIQFYLPSSASNAMIVITDLSGKTVQQYNHLTTGSGMITINAGTLAPATYQYLMIVDGKVVDTKQMVLIR